MFINLCNTLGSVRLFLLMFGSQTVNHSAPVDWHNWSFVMKAAEKPLQRLKIKHIHIQEQKHVIKAACTVFETYRANIVARWVNRSQHAMCRCPLLVKLGYSNSSAASVTLASWTSSLPFAVQDGPPVVCPGQEAFLTGVGGQVLVVAGREQDVFPRWVALHAWPGHTNTTFKNNMNRKEGQSRRDSKWDQRWGLKGPCCSRVQGHLRWNSCFYSTNKGQDLQRCCWSWAWWNTTPFNN